MDSEFIAGVTNRNGGDYSLNCGHETSSIGRQDPGTRIACCPARKIHPVCQVVYAAFNFECLPLIG